MRSRNTYAEVNVTKFLRNIFEISQKVSLPIASVLKADAYGHGAVELAHVCQENGIGFLVVAFLEEGVRLRESGIVIPILLLNYFDPKYVTEVVAHDLAITVYSFEQMNEVLKNLEDGSRLKVHINVDTGMSRLGLDVRESLELYELLSKDKRVKIEGVYTHFSSADDPEDTMNYDQLEKFESFLRKIKRPRYVHLSNSAASTMLENSMGNMCRIGIASYGLQPSSKRHLDYIEPVMSVHSTVAFVKHLKKGQSVGYDHTFVANKNMKVATIPIGYSDGFSTTLSNKGSVLINSLRAHVLGRVSMDQIVVDVSHVGNVKMGDDVIILGRSGDEEITAEEIASLVGGMNYEIVCGISDRVPRFYVK